MKPVKVLIACGGSGGHIFPGIALAEAIKELNGNSDVFIVTSDRHIDTQIFKEEKFPYSVLPYNPLPNSLNPWKLVKFAARLLGAVVRSLAVLKEYKPNCVVGLGGYVSGPIVFAAWCMRTHTLIHEQNVVPSLTNRLSALFADKICTSFEDTKNYFRRKKAIKTGNPIRYKFLKSSSEGKNAQAERKEKFIILVMGGSQGSSFLNNSFKEALLKMNGEKRSKIEITHITGKNDSRGMEESYNKMSVCAKVYPFLDEIGYAYEIADLVISRAGATALSEISAFGKPAILVPYPKKRIHQLENAKFFSSYGASIYIEEKDLTPDFLKNVILTLMEDRVRLNQMAERTRALSEPAAAHKLARETLALAEKTVSYKF